MNDFEQLLVRRRGTARMTRPNLPSPIGELNERSREIFRLIVDEYVQTGEPIGSRTLSRLLGQHLSPATIRNVMADLEEAGVLFFPPTSGRRPPTRGRVRPVVHGPPGVGQLPGDGGPDNPRLCAAP